MPERYRFEFKAGSTYERVVWLLQRCGPPGGVVVDLGCGYGPLAEPVRDLGFTYAGLDADPEAVADLAGRGFEAGKVALDAGADMAALVGRVTAGRPLAALCLLDVLEHLADGAATLASMRDAVAGHPGAVMLLSVPNVTHVDLAAKLLIGRWDVTPTGLLDETHISLYSESRLKALLGQVGWEEISTEDLIFPRSDQHFPPEAAALDPGSPLGALVHQVRGRLPGATVNQFIGAYRPGPPAPAPAPALLDRFLTVVVRTQGRRRQLLPETLLSLVAQTSQDFDVVLCCHDTDPAARGQVEAAVAALPPDFASRVELVEVTGGGRGRPLNVAFARGRGRYLAVLDDDDVAFAHWVESFANAGAATPGRLLRAVVAGQAVEPTAGPPPAPAGPPPATAGPGYRPIDRPTLPWPGRFSVAEHLWLNRSPLCGWAFPRSCVADLGLRFDEDLPVLEDWDFAVRAALLCGVTEVPEVTSLYRLWAGGDGSLQVHTPQEWERAHIRVRDSLAAGAWPITGEAVAEVMALQAEVEGWRAAGPAGRGPAGAGPERAGPGGGGDEAATDVDGARATLARLRAERDALALDLREARHAVECLRASSSWRVTWPLRAISGVLRARRP